MSADQGGPEGLNPEVLPGPAIEPPEGEQANHGNDSTPPPELLNGIWLFQNSSISGSYLAKKL